MTTQDFIIAKHRSHEHLKRVHMIVRPLLLEDGLEQMELEDFRSLVAGVQDKINLQEITNKFARSIMDTLVSQVGSSDLLIQSNCYLRATRPHSDAKQEAVGWHRESFYGPNMEKCINVWTPIANVTTGNTLLYVPVSATIPDEDIKIEQVLDLQTSKFSAGHKIGLLYSPKVIVGGVDLNKVVPMNVPYGSSSIFAGNLIHGNAINRTNAIRISIDFRVVAKKNYTGAKPHFASGKDYMVELDG